MHNVSRASALINRLKINGLRPRRSVGFLAYQKCWSAVCSEQWYDFPHSCCQSICYKELWAYFNFVNVLHLVGKTVDGTECRWRTDRQFLRAICGSMLPCFPSLLSFGCRIAKSNAGFLSFCQYWEHSHLVYMNLIEFVTKQMWTCAWALNCGRLTRSCVLNKK